MRLVEKMPLDFTAYYDGEDFIGFTIVYPRKSVNWFWYFAVCEELRGKGYGQKILTQIIEHYKGQSFVLDMESPTQVCENIDQRQRRHQFYLRNGFSFCHNGKLCIFKTRRGGRSYMNYWLRKGVRYEQGDNIRAGDAQRKDRHIGRHGAGVATHIEVGEGGG